MQSASPALLCLAALPRVCTTPSDGLDVRPATQYAGLWLSPLFMWGSGRR